jgi:FkbM family methyltransferase
LFFSKLYSIYKIIERHPLAGKERLKALGRFVKWQLVQKLMAAPVVHNFVGETKIILEKGATSATAQYYMGLSEFEEMSFVLHFLRETDFFLDVGANVGCFTLLAAGEIGAETWAIEPLPATFKQLRNNLKINGLEQRVRAFNLGVGDKSGALNFTRHKAQQNHIALETDTDTLKIDIETLDFLLNGKSPVLLKIDVEGFERAVVEGAKATLANTNLKAIIIELVGLGARYGFDESEIVAILNAYGFEKYVYSPFSRSLEKQNGLGFQNTIFIRDFNFVLERVKNAPKFTSLQQKI